MMRAIVLAAGFATRLHPLTRDCAKPLLEVAGRPVLSHILDRVLELDPIEIVIVVNARFADDFRRWLATHGPSVPTRLIDDGAVDDRTKLGALGDLDLALATITPPSDVLVVGGDNLLEFALLPYRRRFATLATPLLLCRTVEDPVPPGRYSEVTLGADGRVLTFREKPVDPRSSLSCICLYFLPADTRSWLRSYLESGGDPDAPGNFFAWLVDRLPLHAAPIAGRFFDIGSHQTLAAARAEFTPLEPRPRDGAPE